MSDTMSYGEDGSKEEWSCLAVVKEFMPSGLTYFFFTSLNLSMSL